MTFAGTKIIDLAQNSLPDGDYKLLKRCSELPEHLNHITIVCIEVIAWLRYRNPVSLSWITYLLCHQSVACRYTISHKPCIRSIKF